MDSVVSRARSPSIVNHTNGGQAFGASHCCCVSRVVVSTPARCSNLLLLSEATSLLATMLLLRPVLLGVIPAHMGIQLAMLTGPPGEPSPPSMAEELEEVLKSHQWKAASSHRNRWMPS